jgi:predicted MFS family arabinose efflux permease
MPAHPPLPAGFRRLAWSNLAAQAGEQMALAAAPLLAVLALGAGPAETGALAAAQSLPFLLLALPAGVLADRLPRRALLMAAEVLRAAALLATPVLLWAGLLNLPLLALLGALAAAGTVVFSVAAPAMVPALVPRAALAAANTRLELARSLAFAGGPGLAGAAVALAGAGTAFALAAALSLAACGLLAGLAEPCRLVPPRRSIAADLAEGLRFVRHHALLRPIMLTAIAWNLSWFVLQAVYVPYALTRLGLDAASVGITLGAYGVGMVAGALLAPAIGRRLRFGWLIAAGPLASVAASLAMLGSTAMPGAVLPALAFFLFGFGPILWTIAQTTLRQAVTPAAMLGRASALMTMATAGARPLGAALGGGLGAAWGFEAALTVAAAGFLAQAAIILASPVRGLATLPDPAVQPA